MQALLNFLASLRNTAKDAFKVELSGSNVEDNGMLNIPLTSRRIYPVSDLVKLTIPTYDGSGQAVHPSVVYIPKGFGPTGNKKKWWMAMTPYPNMDNDYENPSILWSDDGITWTVPTGVTNPLIAKPLEGHNSDVELIFDGTNLIMYYNGDGYNMFQISSSDGVTWSAPTTCSWSDGTNKPSPTIVRHSATSWVGWNAGNYLRKYVSSDGVAFTGIVRCRTNIKEPHWHVSVMPDEFGYHFLLSTYILGKDTNDCKLFYGFSDNGEDIIFDNIPLLSPEQSGWTSRTIYRSCMVPIRTGLVRVYISAFSFEGECGIGYFDAKLNTRTIVKQEDCCTKHIVALNGVKVAAGATSAGGFINFTGTPYVAYSVSANGGTAHSFDIKESAYIDTGGAVASKASTVLGSSTTGFYNSAKIGAIAPRMGWVINNKDSVEHTYSLVITLYTA